MRPVHFGAKARFPAAFALLATVFFAFGCGEVIDQSKANEATKASLEKSLHEKITAVECPSDQSVDPGATFTCSVVFPDGAHAKVTLNIRNSDADLSIVGIDPNPIERGE